MKIKESCSLKFKKPPLLVLFLWTTLASMNVLFLIESTTTNNVIQDYTIKQSIYSDFFIYNCIFLLGLFFLSIIKSKQQPKYKKTLTSIIYLLYFTMALVFGGSFFFILNMQAQKNNLVSTFNTYNTIYKQKPINYQKADCIKQKSNNHLFSSLIKGNHEKLFSSILLQSEISSSHANQCISDMEWLHEMTNIYQTTKLNPGYYARVFNKLSFLPLAYQANKMNHILLTKLKPTPQKMCNILTTHKQYKLCITFDNKRLANIKDIQKIKNTLHIN